jgi:hypothetical protein
MCKCVGENMEIVDGDGDDFTKTIWSCVIDLKLQARYTKNKRGNHYRNGWLDVPEKYSYLKNNSLKRNRTGSRKKRAFSNTGAGSSITLAKRTSTKKNQIAEKSRRKATQLRLEFVDRSSDDEENGEENGMSVEESDG